MHYSSYNSDNRPPRKLRLWSWWWMLGLVPIVLIVWFAAGPILSLRKIHDAEENGGPSFLGFLGKIVSQAQLKGESEGRINILLLGVGGKDHPGGTLADTIQLASINTKTRQVALLSIPRDLRVTIPGVGVDKINYAHAWGEMNPKTGGGPAVIKKVVAEILDQPVHYWVRLDFDGFVKLVDTLGGIDVYVEKPINDPFYPAPDMIRYDPFKITAGPHHLDGKTALKYVRSRETTSDFDRSKRQQQVMGAIKERVLSLNVLANPKKVNEIAKILGEHLKTDLAAWEITRVVEIAAREVSSYTVITRVLSSGAGEPLVAVNEAGYYLVPRTGNFKEIQRIAKNIFTEPLIKEEQAKIEVINASGKSKILSEIVAGLKNEGFTIAGSRTAPSTLSETILFDYSKGSKPNTSRLLAERFGLTPRPETNPQKEGVDFSLVIGSDFAGESS